VKGHSLLTVNQAAKHLLAGEIIAYPTEAVYGLGCDPMNEAAVRRLLALKGRPAEAGLILISDVFDHFRRFIQPLTESQEKRVMSTWPGPVTWLFPKNDNAPGWLTGKHATIALRISAHPVCRALCAAFDGAIVSTSANPRQGEPARNIAQIEGYFGTALAGIVAGELGGARSPSEIRDVASGRVLREGR